MSDESTSQPTAPADFHHVPRRPLLAYGISGVPLNWMGTLMGTHLMFFYTETVYLDPRWYGLAMAIAGVWDAISDPLMGVISDRTRWKWGRRRPYIVMGVPFLALTFYLLLAPPTGLEGTSLGIYFTVVVLLLHTARTIVETPLGGLVPEIAQAYHERTRLASWREAFGNIGDLLGLLLPLILAAIVIGDATGDAEVAGRREGFRLTGLFAAGTCFAVLMLTYAGTYEDSTFQRDVHVGFQKSVRAILGNRAFIVLVAAASLAGVGIGIVNALFLYILRYVVEIDSDEVQGIAFIVYIIGALASYPLWIRIARQLGKPAAFRAGLFASSLTFATVFVLSPERAWFLYVTMVFAGAANVGIWMLVATLGADLMDLDELETGQRREGLYGGVMAFIRKMAGALSSAVLGFGLVFIGFEAGVDQTPETVFRLKLLFVVPTTFLVVISGALFHYFPLTEAMHADVMDQLAKRRVEMGVAHADEIAAVQDGDNS